MITHTLLGEIEIISAITFFTRLKGLLGTKALSQSQALSIMPCRSVHTIGMRYTIHLVCLDKTGRVVAIKQNLQPYRFYIAPNNTYEILEFSAAIHPISQSLVGRQFFIGDKQ